MGGPVQASAECTTRVGVDPLTYGATEWVASPGKRYGNPEPRIYTRPQRALTPDTSLGFDVIDIAALFGVDLLPWQRWLLVHALELNASGGLRFRTIVVLVARQNGKTWLALVLGLWALYVWQCRLVLGTAQDLSLAEEVWQIAVDIIEETGEDGEYVRPEMAAELRRISRVNGNKLIELIPRFVDGSTRRVAPKWQVKATNRRAGRGKTAGLLLLDELREHTSWEAWGALSKTTNAVAEALKWCTSNAGDASSVVLRHLRRLAHLALGDPDGAYADTAATAPVDVDEDADDLAIFEWSAAPAADRGDRDAWAAANPSLGWTITERALASDYRTDPPPVFDTEVLCRWVETSNLGPFAGPWLATVDPESTLADESTIRVGFEVSHDASWATLVAAGHRDDGLVHVEVVARSAGTHWLRPWFETRAGAEWTILVVKGSAADALAGEFEDLPQVTVERVATGDVAQATVLLFDMVSGRVDDDTGEVTEPRFRHLPWPALDAAAATARAKPSGAAWAVDRVPLVAGDDPTPLIAVVVAVWGLLRIPVPAVSVYEGRGVLSI